MKKYFAEKIFHWFWPEIRMFARWTMHSGHCRQSISQKDYERYLSERDEWRKIEDRKQRIKDAMLSE